MRRNHRQRLRLWSIQGCGASNSIRLFTQNTSTSRHHVCSKSCLGRGTSRPDANLGLSSVSAAAFSSCAGRADGCVHMILRSERATKAPSACGHSTPHVERHSPPALHLFCGTAAQERTWFRDASTSRHAFTSIASFPALAHDWALDAITHALPASAPSWTAG